MKESFKPNGGRNIRQSSSYNKAKSLYHHAIAKLHKKGRATLLPWELLAATEKSNFHINPLVWAPKSDSWEGRTCLNLSHGGQLSINEGTDLSRSDAIYKSSRLPDVHSLCEMIELVSENNPGENIHGGTVDVSAAYQQFSLTTEAARFRSALIDVPHGNTTKRVLATYLVGVFGDTWASFVYNTIGRALDFKHNQHRKLKRSETYMDDGINIDVDFKLEQSLKGYCDNVEFLMGNDSVKPEKRLN
jgi:hypothetical protein